MYSYPCLGPFFTVYVWLESTIIHVLSAILSLLLCICLFLLIFNSFFLNLATPPHLSSNEMIFSSSKFSNKSNSFKLIIFKQTMTIAISPSRLLIIKKHKIPCYVRYPSEFWRFFFQLYAETHNKRLVNTGKYTCKFQKKWHLYIPMSNLA